MTATKIVDLLPHFALNLKNEFDRVQPEKKAPDAETSGKLDGEPELNPRIHLEKDVRSLAGSPKSHNTLGETMTTPFRKIPEWLHTDIRFIDAEHYQQSTFNRLLHLVVSKPTEYNIKGNIVILQPGQYCCARRELARQCGKNFSEENIRGTIRYFTKVQFLTQTLTHGKTLLTLCDRIINDMFFGDVHPNSHPPFTQTSPIKQDYSLNTLIKSDNLRGGVGGGKSYEQSPQSPLESPLFHSEKKEKKYMQYTQKEVEDVEVFCKMLKLEIKKSTIEIWHRKFGNEKVTRNLGLMVGKIEAFRREETKEKIDSHEKWMEWALKFDVGLEKENIRKNHEYAVEFKSLKNWTSLQISKNGCSWGQTGELGFKMAHKEFTLALQKGFELQQSAPRKPREY